SAGSTGRSGRTEDQGRRAVATALLRAVISWETTSLSEQAEQLARQQLDRRGSRRRGHHRIDVACAVTAVLAAVRGVDLIVDVFVGGGREAHVLADAAGLDVARAAYLGGAEPSTGATLPRPDVKVVADADNPDGHGVSERVIAAD